MSYDIHLLDPKTGEVLWLDEPHDLTGGTYAVGGTREAWLNVTWNYGKHYYRVMGEKGIRAIYGLTAAQSIPVLEAAMAALGDERSPDYWEATEGNAKAALGSLLELARLAPEGVWGGD